MYTGPEWTIIGLIAAINFYALLICFRDVPPKDSSFEPGTNRIKDS